MNREPLPTSFYDSEEERQQAESAIKNALAPTKEPGNTTPMDRVRAALAKLEAEFAKVLPEHIKPATFTRVVMTTIQKKPDLLDLDKHSLLAACMTAAQDGLLLDGREAALVPQGEEVRYSPMVWGLMKLVRNSGSLASVVSNLVYAKDTFRIWVDERGEHLQHEQFLTGDRGELTGVYGMFVFKEAPTQVEYMTKKQVMDVKSMSKARSGPWTGPFETEMWKKAVLRRLSKRADLSPELRRAIERDDDMYDFTPTPAHERGLAKELNNGEEPSDQTGDQIRSLRDLRADPNGPVPHQDLRGDAAGRGVEHGADVPASPRGAGGGDRDLHQEVPAVPAGPGAQGMGDRRSPVPRKPRAANPPKMAGQA